MATLLEEYKKNNPQDAEIPNGALAYILWEKDYKGNADDPVSLEQYAKAVGLDENEALEMTKFSQKADALAQQQEQTGEQPEEEMEGLGFARSVTAAEGFTFGWGDELFASVAALDDVLTEGKDFSSAYKKYQAEYQAKMDEYSEKKPLESMALELVGGFAMPMGILKTPKVLADLVTKGSKIRKIGLSATAGAASGASYGAGSAAPGERTEGAIEGGAFGFGLGAAGQVIVGKIKNVGLKRQMRATAVNPTLQGLQKAKDAAYKKVDESGVKFTKDELDDLKHDIHSDILASRTSTYQPEFHKNTALAIKYLQNRIDEQGVFRLSDLETTKKYFNQLYNASKGKDSFILDMINKIDDKIEKKFANNQDNVVQAARLANTRYRKFKDIDDAIKKAETTAEASGQPGVLKYREIIARILNDEKKMKFYTAEERAAMEAYVKGSFSENLMKNIGKFAPTTTGLLSFLHLGAVIANPGLSALTAGSLLARRSAVKGERAGIEDIQRVIGAGGDTLADQIMKQQQVRQGMLGRDAYEGVGAVSGVAPSIIGENI